MPMSDNPLTLVNDVNGRIGALLTQHGKDEFRAEMSLKLPDTPENSRKYWSAIMQRLQHLREMNIPSATDRVKSRVPGVHSAIDLQGGFVVTISMTKGNSCSFHALLQTRSSRFEETWSCSSSGESQWPG